MASTTRANWQQPALGGLLGLLLVAGCAFRHAPEPARVTSTAVSSGTSDAEPPQPTVTEAYAEGMSTTSVSADTSPVTNVVSGADAPLRPDAPQLYVVKRGDTLWGLASMFLRNPWQWPQIWYANRQIRNPHWIYPGDSLRIVTAGDGTQALQLVRAQPATGSPGRGARIGPMLRTEPLDAPISTIPYNSIASFLSHPGVMTQQEIKTAPYVVALRDHHVIAAAGREIYVHKLPPSASGGRYSVLHVDEPLRDPESHRNYGYMTIYTGVARIDRPGNVAKATLVESERETLEGDVLVQQNGEANFDIQPHAPASRIRGRILAVVDNVLMAGQYDVVVLNRGSADGLDRGTVLAVESKGEDSLDTCVHVQGLSTCTWSSHLTVPPEGIGSVLVFKTYDHLSYALITRDIEPVRIGDHVRNP